MHFNYIYFLNFKLYFMSDNNKSRSEQPDASKDTKQKSRQDTKVSNDNKEQNPQEGGEWENYRTRELSSKEEKKPSKGSGGKSSSRQGYTDPL
jgi:hypothetical protein